MRERGLGVSEVSETPLDPHRKRGEAGFRTPSPLAGEGWGGVPLRQRASESPLSLPSECNEENGRERGLGVSEVPGR